MITTDGAFSEHLFLFSFFCLSIFLSSTACAVFCLGLWDVRVLIGGDVEVVPTRFETRRKFPTKFPTKGKRAFS